uniref:uncharacterized protein LOC122600242 isoform X1 n=1 Tax=Erigeron canadensis TaxID=72917 RepID=UPI001CB8C268|nr:uncharacterized protein LOC122600242 isoform X1 [Erigeron canadensis]
MLQIFSISRDLSTEFEERVIAIHKEQMEKWQEEIKEHFASLMLQMRTLMPSCTMLSFYFTMSIMILEDFMKLGSHHINRSASEIFHQLEEIINKVYKHRELGVYFIILN